MFPSILLCSTYRTVKLYDETGMYTVLPKGKATTQKGLIHSIKLIIGLEKLPSMKIRKRQTLGVQAVYFPYIMSSFM